MGASGFNHAITYRLVLIAGVVVLVALAFSVSFASMWSLWQTSDHRHGLLVFPIAAFLVWRIRHELSVEPIVADVRGLVVLAPMAVGWVIARLSGIQVAEHLLVLGMIPVCVAAIAGFRLVRKALFPLLFILLATPLGDSLVPHLMLITADTATAFLKLSGIPFLRDGQYISLRGGEFVVADVCSGIRYLLTGFMISLLFGYLTYTSIGKRVLLVVITSVALVIANGIRAYIVMSVASATDMEYFGGRDHIYFGWLMFGVVMMLIMWIGARYADEEPVTVAGKSDTTEQPATHTALPLIAALGIVMLGVTIKPLQKDFGEAGALFAAIVALLVFVLILVRIKPGTRSQTAANASPSHFQFYWQQALVIVATFVVVFATPVYAGIIEDDAVDSVHRVDLTDLSCKVSGPWQEPWQPDFGVPDFATSGSLDCAGQAVAVYVAAFASALQGKELISSAHRVVPSAWDRVVVVSRRREGNHDIVEIRVDSDSYPAIIWYWYEIDGHATSSPLGAKIRQVLALLKRRPAGGRVVVLKTDNDATAEIVRRRLAGVADELTAKGAQVPLEMAN